MEIIAKSDEADTAGGVNAEGGGKNAIHNGESVSGDNGSGEETACFIHLHNTVWCQPFSESVRGEDERS